MALVEIGTIDAVPATVAQELRVMLRSKSTAASFFYPVPGVALMLTATINGQFPILGLLGVTALSLITPFSIWLEAKVNYEQSSRKQKARERSQARVRKESIELAALSSRHAITDLRNHAVSQGDLSLALGALERAADAWDAQPVAPHDQSRKRLQASLERISKSCGMILEDPNLLATETEFYEMVDAVMSVTERLEKAVYGTRALCAPALVVDNHFAPALPAPERIAA